ncbi:MAG TPA: helix-turn-helix transcriptional regulator [Candidatus Faecousia faecigallinarum]|nr:helix-turn-helix transcriptional regulator [Candidatus Faecousia faecigallinarum]
MDEAALAKQIGENMARYRVEAGLTQAQLADKINVTPAFISRVERGEKRMKISTLVAAAKSLQVSCDALIFRNDPASQMATIQRLLADEPAEYVEAIAAMVRLCTEHFTCKGEKG